MVINLLGKGFIGTHYANMYPCVVNDRNDLVPKSDDVLYMISTVDNYNVTVNPYLDIDTNLTTLIRVLENWRHRNPSGVFNFVSSWFVYGKSSDPVTEDSYCDPKGFYSITKRTAEQLLVSYCETYDLKYRILRIANVLGPGDLKASKKKNVITYLINELKQNNPVCIYNRGQIVRDYIHVRDVCRALNLVISNGDANSIYNIGNGEPVKFIDIIEYAKSLGSTSEITFAESEVSYDYLSMNVDKLKSLGYRPTYTVFEIIKELYFA